MSLIDSIYPFKLSGAVKSPIWGGTRLLQSWNLQTDRATVGESWALTVRRDEMSRVCNGAAAGRTVGELIDADRDALLGKTVGGSADFPLLVKLIDAADRLSVQVHPDDDYAARVEHDRGKTEMWYIVEAEEHAEIICGLQDGVTHDELARAVADGAVERVLKHQPVRAGETYFIPSGLPHAIGKGILIAEIQQNCDLTYRVYDYDRRDAAGRLRELHVQKALDVIRPFTEEEISHIRYARLQGTPPQTVLADCAYFRVELLTLQEDQPLTLPSDGYLRHLLCLDGSAVLETGARCDAVAKGDSYLLPAALESLTLRGHGQHLLSRAY